jgi:predicted dehydrogenase
MAAGFRFPDGSTARMICALLSARLLRAGVVVNGTAGEMRVTFPFLPHLFHRLTVHSRVGIRHEHIEGASTYTYQLRAFVQAVRTGVPVLTDAVDAVANMRVIDAIYAKAGLQLRGIRTPSG